MIKQEMKQNRANVETPVVNIPSDFRRRRIVVGLRWATIMSALTMAALTVMQEPVGWAMIAWVALVPWVLAAAGAEKTWQAVWISYAAGLIYYLGNLYWLVVVTPLGYAALCFYLAWYFPLTGYILRRIYLRRRWPMTFVLPVIWVGQEYLRANLLTGFGWLFLGHSQHEQLRLIQMCDLFGVYAVTFLIAMVNGQLCDMLLRPLQRPARVKGIYFTAVHLSLIILVCLAGAVGYGSYRLKQGRNTISEGATITVIQEAIPQYVKQQSASAAEIFRKHQVLSKAALAAEAKPVLIVWPETICAPLNREFLSLTIRDFDLSKHNESERQELRDILDQSKQQDEQLRQLAGEGVAVLVGASNLKYVPGGVCKWNSAELYLSDGGRCPRRYDKMHLVPFGEVVPFRESWPWLYRQLNRLTPYDYEYTLDAGDEPTVFEITTDPGDSTRFAVAICYEDVMPAVVRRLAGIEQERKRIDFLLNISNDGWFVRGGKDSPITATTELIQHLVICKFRAVENRIPIARAVNTGISGFIRPDGRVQHAGPAGTLPDDPADRQAIAGFLTDRVMLDSRVSCYNRIGDSFAAGCTILAGVLLLAGLAPLRQKRSPIQPPQVPGLTKAQ